jgi:hypothetical protein
MTSKEERLREAGARLGKYYVGLKLLREGPTDTALMSEALRSADQCEADIEYWRGQGVADGDRIFSYDLNDHPKARDNTVPFSEFQAICREYRPLHARYKVARDLYVAEGALESMRNSSPDESYLTGDRIAELERDSNRILIAEALAGARGFDQTTTVGRDGISLAEYETRVAGPLAELGPRWLAAARAALRARNAKAAAPYVAAGIAGQKLDLIVSYEGVYWRLPGGGRTDDPKKLAKANVLFQWLESQDPDDPRYTLNTIRRYQFDGNDLENVSEKRYRRPRNASLEDTFK